MAGVPKSPLTPALERARSLIASGGLEPAQVLLERAVELGRENLGEDHPDVLTAQRELAGVFLLSDDPMAARRMLEDAHAAGQWKLGDDDPVMLHISHDLGVVAEELGNKHEARKAFGRVTAHGPAVLGEGHQFIARARAYLGEDLSTAAVRPEAPPAEPVPPAPQPPADRVPPAPQPPADRVPPVEPVRPAPQPPVRPAPEPPVRPGPPPADRVLPVPRPPVEPIQAVPPVASGHAGHGLQYPVVDGAEGHGAAGRPDPRAAIEHPTDLLPVARPWDGAPQPSQPGPPVVYQQYGHGVAQAGHPAPPVYPPAPGWPGGTPVAAVQTHPWSGENSGQAHPYQSRGRGLAVALTVAATLVALTAVGALVVVLLDREQPPVVAQPTASAGPVLAGDPPSAVRLDDRGAVVELTWRDPTKGKVPFVVSMAREGQQLKPVSNVGPGETEALVEGLNAKLEYCFAVVAVYATDRFASSGQVCTERS
jgi:hypothetical protein